MSKTWVQLGQDIDGEAAGDQSGYSVSLNADGSRVAIGARLNDRTSGNARGQTRIYDLSGNTWVQVGQDIDGEAADDESGLSVSLNADGSRVAIGAPYNDGQRGQTRIYDLTGNTWVQVGQDIDGEAANDYSGWSVSLSADGTRVAIGAPYNDGTRGQTRIYDLSGNTWVQVGQDIDGEATGDESGYSVSLSADGTRVAIGAPRNDGTRGQTRIYDLSGNTWVQVGQDIDGEYADDWSGWSVSLSADGSRVAIGAIFNDESDNNRGQTRIYDLSGNNWVQVGQDIDGEAANDFSGFSVSLNADGSRVAIGAIFNDEVTGQTRIYDLSGNTWVQVGQDIDGEYADDWSGWSVSLSADGSRVAIGAPRNDGTSDNNSGQTRIYQLKTVTTLSNFYPNGIFKEKYTLEPTLSFNLVDPSSNSDGSFNYTSSDTSVATISGNTVTVYTDGSSNITATQAATINYTSAIISTVLLVSNICFVAGTLITTDQGIIAIEKINPDIHTIDGKKITGITQTISSYDFIVCFEKHALANNVPSRKTLMTHGHEVFYNGKMIKAIDFINKNENVYKVKYRGEILYNVLMEKHDKMEVHNMICETLNPENPIAKLYIMMKNSTPEEQKRMAKEYNEYTIKNNKFTEKQLKHLNKCL
jgi:hypothetical protein